MKQLRSAKKSLQDIPSRKTVGNLHQNGPTTLGARNVVSSAKINKTIVQYVLPLGNGWVVKSSDQTVFTAITESKNEAISIARTLAKSKHIPLVVHGRNGEIELKEKF